MPHVTFVSMSGFRIKEAELAALGMSLPGLTSRAKSIAALPPLGLLTLAGLTPDHWSMSLHEASEVTGDLVDRIVGETPTLVAISALTASIIEAYALADTLRSQGAPVVLGGLHVTACPEEASRHADAVVVGDGEPTWQTLLTDSEQGKLRPVYRSSKPFDLSEAPLPRFDLLGEQSRPRFTLQASRGCPFACDFCAASRLLGPFRSKPAARIRDELAVIKEKDPRPFIELADDNTFALGGPHEEVLDVFAEADVRWFTEADWRLGENPRLLERLASSGCVQVLVGLESLVHDHKGMGAKQTSMARMMDAVEAIQETGVAVIGCYIVGSDGETHDSLDRLSSFLDSDPCADAQITLQTPFPGTALRRRLEKEGRILEDCDWSHHTLFDVTYRPDRMTADEMAAGFRQLLIDAFGAGPTRRRMQIRRETWGRNPAFAGGDHP
ncbi:MAG: radical SAM protein [Phycisphaera sp.]|nr:MAG: radical SAM protein [Phycisphaera sp.]